MTGMNKLNGVILDNETNAVWFIRSGVANKYNARRMYRFLHTFKSSALEGFKDHFYIGNQISMLYRKQEC